MDSLSSPNCQWPYLHQTKYASIQWWIYSIVLKHDMIVHDSGMVWGFIGHWCLTSQAQCNRPDVPDVALVATPYLDGAWSWEGSNTLGKVWRFGEMDTNPRDHVFLGLCNHCIPIAKLFGSQDFGAIPMYQDSKQGDQMMGGEEKGNKHPRGCIPFLHCSGGIHQFCTVPKL